MGIFLPKFLVKKKKNSSSEKLMVLMSKEDMLNTQGNSITSTSINDTSSRGVGRNYSTIIIGKVEEFEQGVTLQFSAWEMLLCNQPQLFL
jgi:hypothetical protein